MVYENYDKDPISFWLSLFRLEAFEAHLNFREEEKKA